MDGNIYKCYGIKPSTNMGQMTSNSPRTVYIASPYSIGDAAVNVRVQIDAANELMDKGFIPYAPLMSHFHHFVHPRSHAEWMRIDLVWVSMCDCLLRLPGESDGADREVRYAESLGKPVFYGIKELMETIFPI
jgi:hypothetical protein